MHDSLERGLFGRLRAGAGPLWTDYVGHAFVRGLGDGTLPAPAFRRYLLQDYLFLIGFARAYALAGYKSASLEDLRAASAGLAAILAEMPLHVAFSAEWGLDEAADVFARHAPNLVLIPPQSKRLACGDIGLGAMAEVTTIAEVVRRWAEQAPEPSR